VFVVAMFIDIMDGTIVNTALPAIGKDLHHGTPSDLAWIILGYLMSLAIWIPASGWLGDRFGTKKIFLFALLMFTVASALCGLAPTLPLLILFRVIQGATGGVMQPMSQAVLLEAFAPAERGKAMGFWGLGIVVAPILGPVLGGWLTDNYSWRWVFYINIPIGVLSVVLIRMFVHDPAYIKRAAGATIDYLGIGLMTVGIGCLQIMLDKGQEDDWFQSTLITTMAVLAIGGLIAFVVRELNTEHPIVDLHIFKDRTYAVGATLMTVVGFVLFGSLVLLPVMMQTLLGYPPIQAGIALAPRGMGSLIAMPLVGLITQRVDSRKLVALGLLMGGVTLIWLGDLNLTAGYWDFFWPQFLQGVALGLLFVPLTTVTMGAIPREQMGNAASIFNLVRNIGAGVGIASVTTMLTRDRATHAAALGEHITMYDPRIRATVGAIPDLHAVAGLQGLVMRQAALMSFIDSFRILGWVFLALIPLVLLMRRQAKHAPVVVVAE
ncbi:MAG: DHA2 family efflux MFS transporter permease subunit, partial [Acidobacteriota bacterium]